VDCVVYELKGYFAQFLSSRLGCHPELRSFHAQGWPAKKNCAISRGMVDLPSNIV